jgi:hypothetical protein
MLLSPGLGPTGAPQILPAWPKKTSPDLFCRARFCYNAASIRRTPVTHLNEETELTVTTPDEPGIFGRVLGTLANAGVNVRALYAYSDDAGGHFHLITSDAKKAETALRTLGYKVKSKKVITVLVTDRIGAGAEIGALLGNAVVDIRYSYGSSAGEGKTLLVFHTSNNRKAVDTLK